MIYKGTARVSDIVNQACKWKANIILLYVLGKEPCVAQEVKSTTEGQEIYDSQELFFLKKKWQNQKARVGTYSQKGFSGIISGGLPDAALVKSRTNKLAFINFMHCVLQHWQLLCQSYDSVKVFFFFWECIERQSTVIFYEHMSDSKEWSCIKDHGGNTWRQNFKTSPFFCFPTFGRGEGTVKCGQLWAFMRRLNLFHVYKSEHM